MSSNHSILIVDDIKENLELLSKQLTSQGYDVEAVDNGIEALKFSISTLPDLIMLDVNMPMLSGLDVCAQLKQHPIAKDIPIILVTADSETEDIVQGFEIGADDYLIKPYNKMEMLARVRSMLRIKDAREKLKVANEKLDDINRYLELKVQKQVQELEKVNRLRRFFSPQIVKTITSENSEAILQGHRGEITVVFLDLRNFSSFAEKTDPQEVINTVRQFHQTVGPIIYEYEGTLERFTGDGLMVFLGDPEPMPDHALKAVQMAIDIQNKIKPLVNEWQNTGLKLGLGIGIATGQAAMGSIGFEERQDYAAIGTVTNLASRLCSKAESDQILISESTYNSLNKSFNCQHIGNTGLKGFNETYSIYNIDY